MRLLHFSLLSNVLSQKGESCLLWNKAEEEIATEAFKLQCIQTFYALLVSLWSSLCLRTRFTCLCRLLNKQWKRELKMFVQWCFFSAKKMVLTFIVKTLIKQNKQTKLVLRAFSNTNTVRCFESKNMIIFYSCFFLQLHKVQMTIYCIWTGYFILTSYFTGVSEECDKRRCR